MRSENGVLESQYPLVKLNNLVIRDFVLNDLGSLNIIHLKDKFTEVFNDLAKLPEFSGIYVVDHNCTFAGIIRRSDIIYWKGSYLDSIFNGDKHKFNGHISVTGILNSTTIRDIMNPNSVMGALKLDDKATEAIKKMYQLQIISLPIVDGSYKLIGKIELSNILNALVRFEHTK